MLIALQDDPAALASVRVIIFEIGGTVTGFLQVKQSRRSPMHDRT
jgi:hypothetical protein